MLSLRPEAEIKIFGSQMTKILTPSSDLDIAIINVPEGDGGLIERLYDLEKIIREKGENLYEFSLQLREQCIISEKVAILLMQELNG